MNKEELTTTLSQQTVHRTFRVLPKAWWFSFAYSCQGALRKETIECRIPTNTTKSINQPVSLHSGTFWSHFGTFKTCWNFYPPGFSRGCCLAATGAPGLALIGWMTFLASEFASACQWIILDSLWSTWIHLGKAVVTKCQCLGQVIDAAKEGKWVLSSVCRFGFMIKTLQPFQPAASDQSGRAMIPTCTAVVAWTFSYINIFWLASLVVTQHYAAIHRSACIVIYSHRCSPKSTNLAYFSSQVPVLRTRPSTCWKASATPSRLWTLALQ